MGRHDSEIDPNSTDKIGTRLRLARRGSDTTLTQVAKDTGYTKGHLSGVETNQSKPSKDLVSLYEKVLGIQEGSIFQDVSPINPDGALTDQTGNLASNLITRARHDMKARTEGELSELSFAGKLELRLNSLISDPADRELAKKIILVVADTIGETIKRERKDTTPDSAS